MKILLPHNTRHIFCIMNAKTSNNDVKLDKNDDSNAYDMKIVIYEIVKNCTNNILGRTTFAYEIVKSIVTKLIFDESSSQKVTGMRQLG